MTQPERKHSPIRPHTSEGPWYVNDRRYFGYARLMLKELEELKIEIERLWPAPLDRTLHEEELSPHLLALTKKRDLLSDSIQIFSAMCIEAFINFYGVLRFGEEEFRKNFERLGIVNKLQTLLLVCDQMSISKHDPLIVLLIKISSRRNTLVHPKTQEFSSLKPEDLPLRDRIPDVAREAVADMENFLQEFVVAVPGMAHHVPPQSLNGA